MRGIPNELMHASEIDGANTCVVFFKIIFPLCLPVISLVAVNTFIGVWNDFMGPLMFLKDESQYTLAVGVYMKFIGSVNLNNLANIQMATGMLLIIPPAILFFIFQKQLIEGVTLGGVKE